jgi:cell division protein FtsL
MSDKNELLDEVSLVINPQKVLSFAFYLYILLIVMLVLIFAFPKIYLQQQIYFKSREIAKLQSEYETLKEENRLISTSVESIRFKNQILDTLF